LSFGELASFGFYFPKLGNAPELNQQIAKLGRVEHFQADGAGGFDQGGFV
jgi:hypothetical protein